MVRVRCERAGFFLHYVYTTLPSEGQDYIVDKKERERLKNNHLYFLVIMREVRFR